MVFSKNKECGIALLLTIIVLSIIVVVTYQLVFMTNIELRLSKNKKGEIQNYYAIRSAANIAALIIKDDISETKNDNLQEYWASVINKDIGDSKVSMRIEDAERKFNINQLILSNGSVNQNQKNIFIRLLIQLGYDDNLIDKITESIIDFIDSDNSGNYEEFAKNSKLLMPEELLQIPELSSDVLYGKQTEEGTIPGLLDFITIWGTGQININTTSREILMALSDEMSEDLADEIISFRQPITAGEEGEEEYIEGNEDIYGFTSVDELNKVDGMASNIYSQISKYCTVNSTYFICYINSTSFGSTKNTRVVFQKLSKLVRPILWDEVSFSAVKDTEN